MIFVTNQSCKYHFQIRNALVSLPPIPHSHVPQRENKNMKVLIADNYPLSCAGLVQLLSSNFPNPKLVEAHDDESISESMSQEKFDLAILALSHPGKSSISVLKKMKQEDPAMPVLIICIYPEELYGIRSLKTGAAGYLSRESPLSEVLTAVNRLLAGEIYLSPFLAMSVSTRQRRQQKQSHELLSDRELQILQLMASGNTAKKISAQTSLSVNTISTYRSRILAKLKFKTNAELTRFAIENALV
jgi:DNA-binding NarL/FixJ family response regulator